MKLFNSAIFIALCFTLISCDQHSSQNKKSASIEVIDFSGEVVKLDQPAKKIVALAPHIVENIYSAGAGDHLIGVIEHSDFPEEAKTLDIVGSYTTINHEQILKLNPDLIIAWQSGNSFGSLQKLKDLGFKFYIDQLNSLEDVAKSIRDIGILTGQEATANPVAESYLEELNRIKQENQGKSPVSVFYQVWNQPLQTINGKHIISSAINLCGGINIFAEELSVAPIVNIESILQKDPTLIVASGISNTRPDWLDDWLQWESLSAVRNNHLFFIDPDHIQRHTVRILFGIKRFCDHFDIVRGE